ncbi:MAG: cobyrinate a,c-diamide synthase [Desulfovermiculus sp.]
MLHIPRLTIAGLRGGSGKTILSLGLAKYWNQAGWKVKPFKKGPDYIDAVWLSRAAGHTATNLDPFLMSDAQIRSLFVQGMSRFDVALIEGNRGLFDGKDLDGSCSTAHLARLLDSPVVLIIDCTKMTRTAAAMLQGCVHFEPDVRISGVVLNNTAGSRHRSILRQCIETYCDLPVLGTLPRLKDNPIPERHMGLISDREHASDPALETIARTIGEWLDVDKISDIALHAPEFSPVNPVQWPAKSADTDPVRIGVVKDASLWFYYPENLEALSRAGARIEEVSLLTGQAWPDLHGLYLGGGFPETQASELSSNAHVRDKILTLARKGLPIYAECGGLMYLCTTLFSAGHAHSMVGVFPFQAKLSRKPQGHGYTLARVNRPNPFYRVGYEFYGHEFHYSKCLPPHDGQSCVQEPCLQMLRGTGLGQSQDGLLFRNTFACYTHVHALSVPDWAENFVRAAATFRRCLEQGLDECPDIRMPF